MTIIKKRLAKIAEIELKKGGHRWTQDAFCVMEAVAYVAGEPWSAHPKCACPVLTVFATSWNDALDDDTRQRLKPYVPRLVGTSSSRAVEQCRSWMACDWLVRMFTPRWLHHAGLDDDAHALEALPELTTAELVSAAMPAINKARASADAAWAAVWDATGDIARDTTGAAARDAAGAAAGAAARDAAGTAARDAARAAVWDAAGDTAWGAAWDAVWDAAWAAAWGAVWDAAGAAAWAAAWGAAGAVTRDAARDALASTVTGLQDSAFELLDRMIAVTPESVAA